MRLALVLTCLLAGCAGGGPGSRWPKQTTAEEDGGESLAPRQGARELGDDAAGGDAPSQASSERASEPSTAAGSAATSGSGGASGSGSASSPTLEEVLNAEEIVIEVDD